MQRLYTPKQVARALGVSEASLKRWCDRDFIMSIRTAGGHRRLTPAAVMSYLKQSGRVPVRPEVLGLPPNVGKGATVIERAESDMRAALERGDVDCFGRLVFDLHLAGQPLPDICDRIIARAFHGMGDRWAHGEIEVYQERRGCEIAMRLLYRLEGFLPPPSQDAPLAFGGTISGDPYTLPTTMAEIVLREEGWEAESFGVGLPVETLRAALASRRPRLLWLSFSVIGDRRDFLAGCDALYRAAAEQGVALVVGGRALSVELRQEMRYSAFCDNLGHLAAFARTLYVSPAAPNRTSPPTDSIGDRSD